jgi:hypothetical protein
MTGNTETTKRNVRIADNPGIAALPPVCDRVLVNER